MVETYKYVKDVLDEATKRFSVSGLGENDKKRQNVMLICEQIDKFAEEFEAKEFFIEVNEETCNITFELICEEFEITKPEHPFYLVSKCAKNIEFRCGGGIDTVIIRFMFPGIWE